MRCHTRTAAAHLSGTWDGEETVVDYLHTGTDRALKDETFYCEKQLGALCIAAWQHNGGIFRSVTEPVVAVTLAAVIKSHPSRSSGPAIFN